MIVYTCITNNKDLLHTMPEEEGVKYVCFSEKPLPNKQWEHRKLEYHDKNPRRVARWHKTHPHTLFPDEDITIWIDGSLRMLEKPSYYASKLNNSFIGSRPHPTRDCIYQEMQAVKYFNYETDDNLLRIYRRLKMMKYPENNGLAETGLLVRKNNDEATKFNEEWWMMINRMSLRDQLSFNYILWKQKKTYDIINRHSVVFEGHVKPTTQEE